jgi:hypothetical protein
VVCASLIFKLVEFDQFKNRIMQLFPESQKFNGASAPHPIFNDICGGLAVPVLCDIG